MDGDFGVTQQWSGYGICRAGTALERGSKFHHCPWKCPMPVDVPVLPSTALLQSQYPAFLEYQCHSSTAPTRHHCGCLIPLQPPYTGPSTALLWPILVPVWLILSCTGPSRPQLYLIHIPVQRVMAHPGPCTAHGSYWPQ